MSDRTLQVHPSRIEIVKKAYKTSGHTNQIEFAREVGFSDDALRAFLNGKPVYRETFMKFCEALELDHKELLGEAAPNNSSNATTGTQINQSVENNYGFVIGTVGTLNQNNSDKSS
ncbi:MAG: helix-turn-helix transcriptional regulator [Cyanobacteria bacterium P01_D01_bin.156]